MVFLEHTDLVRKFYEQNFDFRIIGFGNVVEIGEKYFGAWEDEWKC